MKINLSLKKLLMNLGNNLVTQNHYDPCLPTPEQLNKLVQSNSTQIIGLFTEWVNQHPEVQQGLAELGFSWEMPENKSQEEKGPIEPQKIDADI